MSAPAAGARGAPGASATAADPVLFVTGHVPAYRVGALAVLHEAVGLEVARFGGSRRHGGPDAPGQLPFPSREAGPRELYRLAASGRYRAVVCPTGGRAALLASWAGARAGRVPVILWASLWAHPRTPAHALSYLPLRRLYRSAQAVVTYGPHVSAYVRRRGAVNVFEAPQAVDNEFWSAAGVAEPELQDWPRGDGSPEGAPTRFVFVGRAAREKGLAVLIDAWTLAGPPAGCELVLVGPKPGDTGSAGAGATDAAGGGTGPAGARPLCLDPRPRCSGTGAAAGGVRPRGRAGRALDTHGELPRAVGAGGQRGHEPGDGGDRQRRRRGRRRWARARRRHRDRGASR